MSGLSAGELDREVTIQQLTESIGGSNYPIESWSTLVSTVFMSRRDMRGYEIFKSGGLDAAANTVWQMQYRDDMDPELVDVQKTRRLLANGRSYDIVAASVIGFREGIELVTISSSAVRQ